MDENQEANFIKHIQSLGPVDQSSGLDSTQRSGIDEKSFISHLENLPTTIPSKPIGYSKSSLTAPAPKAIEPEKPELTWEETAKGAASQILPSTGKMIGDIFHAVTSPVETGSALKQLGAGAYSKLEGFFANQDPQQKKQNEALLNAVVDDYIKKYGSVKEFKRALAEDPASILADISLLVSGGTTAALKGTGLAGKTAGMAGAAAKVLEKTGQAAQFIDPLYSGAKIAALPLTGVGKFPGLLHIVPAVESFLSGASYSSLRDAAKAGASGTPSQREAFRSFQTGTSQPVEMVGHFKDALRKAFDDRSEKFFDSYQKMFGSGNIPLTDYSKYIDPAVNAAFKIGHSIDPVTGAAIQINREAAEAFNLVLNKIHEFKIKPSNSRFANLQGAHDLKQAIGDFRDNYRPGTRGRKVIDDVYNSILNTIKSDPNIGPQYAKTMKAYGETSDRLSGIISELGIGSSKNSYNALKKLLKIKDSGTKRSMLAELSNYNPNLPYMIAGAELNQFFPTGVRGAIIGATGLGLTASVAGYPAALAQTLVHSPRVLSTANYMAGRAAGPVVSTVASPAGRAGLYGAVAANRPIGSEVPSNELDKYLQAIGMVESGGDLRAVNRLSNARGRYQFMPETWQAIRRSNKELNLPADINSASAEQQLAAAQAFTNQNYNALRSKIGRDPTYADLGLSHYFGASGAAALLNLPDGTRFDSLPENFWQRLGEKFSNTKLLEQNPNLRNQTVGGIKRYYENLMRKSGLATGGRVARASGGRIMHEDASDKLIRAVEIARKGIGKQTEEILNKPDEHVVQALAVANRHI